MKSEARILGKLDALENMRRYDLEHGIRNTHKREIDLLKWVLEL